MRKDIIKPIYMLIGLLFIALFVQGYFIYDLKKESIEQKKEVPLTHIPTHSSVAQTNNFRDPFIEIQKIQEHMMKEFGSFNSMFANDPFFQSAFSNNQFSAMSDIIEKDREYIVEIKIPGVDGQNIKLKNEANMIHVSAQSQNINEKNNANYIHKESYGNYFQRSFTMPDDANLDTIKSDYKDGVLKLVIQKNSN